MRDRLWKNGWEELAFVRRKRNPKRKSIEPNSFKMRRDASKRIEIDAQASTGWKATYDCAFFEPLAFPPADLPPVILKDLDLFGGNG